MELLKIIKQKQEKLMYSDNKQIRDVADVAARIMAGLPPLEEKLHPNQQKIDVVDDEKIDGKDFAKLRKMKKEEIEIEEESHQSKTTMKHIPNPTPAQKQAAKDIKPGVGGYRDRIDMLKSAGVKEEVEELDEVSLKTATSAYVKRMGKDDDKSPVKAVKTMDHIAKKHGVVGVARAAKAADKEYGLNDPVHNKRKDFVRGVMAGVKEEVESIDEVKMADLPSTKVQGRAYGASKPEASAFDVLKGPKDKELKSIESEKKKKKMSEMVATYKESGMKAFFESIEKEEMISEEPDSAQFAKELEDQKKRAAGTKPQAEVAKPSVQAVQQEATEQEIQVINADVANGVDAVNIEERTLTAGETDKKEEIVKSMKKGLAGFKERYGKDAKSVMYATATKQAKLKEETDSEQYKAGHEHASDHAQDSGFKVTARARKKEMLADNPHNKGTTEHSDWHRGALDGHQTALDNM
jgi:hypothetical protein